MPLSQQFLSSPLPLIAAYAGNNLLVAGEALRSDVTALDSLAKRAARFLLVLAISKTAQADKRPEFFKPLQNLLWLKVPQRKLTNSR